MNRKELLDLAAQRPDANQFALSWARKVSNPETRSTHTARLERSDARLGRAFMATTGLMAFGVVVIVLGLCVATLVTVLSMFVPSIPGIQDTGLMVRVILMVAAVMAFGLCLACSLADAGAQRTAALEVLKPIAGTEACVSALQYVESGYPTVLAWRELALAEREGLCAFDVEILRCLRDSAEAEASKGSNQLINDEACRKLHGLAHLPGAMREGAA
jgi:hypothetical protein